MEKETAKDICFNEEWNMKGNTREFLSAEKAYRDDYAELLLTADVKIDNDNIAGWLAQEIKHPDLYEAYIKKASDLLSVIKKIVPQDKKSEIKLLSMLSIKQPKNSVMSCVCFHSAMSNICEFVHLHRLPERFKAAAVLVGVANKQLGLGAIHYIRILITLINLAQQDWVKAGAIEIAKVIDKNLLHGRYVPCPCSDIERGIGLAELAYENSTWRATCVLNSESLKITDKFEISGRFHLPLHLGGYIAHCGCIGGFVIGFRGSKNWQNWLTNATQLLVGVSLIYKVALGLVVKMKEKYGSNLLVVGHSLGGGLTQFAVAGLDDYNVVGFGYNSAGLSNMAVDLLKDKYQGGIHHLHLRYDQVFLIGNQLGDCYEQYEKVKDPLSAHKLRTMRAKASCNVPYCELR